MINLNVTSVREKLRAAVKHRRAPSHLANKTRHFSSRGAQPEKEVARFRFLPEKIVKQRPPQCAMRVLLRNDRTMKYLRSPERWTKDPKKARDFRNGWWATLFAFTLNPRHLVIQYQFDDDRYNLNIPVVPESA